MTQRLPRIRRGQTITATYINRIVDTVNGVLQSPRDLDQGLQQTPEGDETDPEATPELPPAVLNETIREYRDRRIFQTGNPENFLDYGEGLESIMVDDADGRIYRLIWVPKSGGVTIKTG